MIEVHYLNSSGGLKVNCIFVPIGRKSPPISSGHHRNFDPRIRKPTSSLHRNYQPRLREKLAPQFRGVSRFSSHSPALIIIIASYNNYISISLHGTSPLWSNYLFLVWSRTWRKIVAQHATTHFVRTVIINNYVYAISSTSTLGWSDP